MAVSVPGGRELCACGHAKVNHELTQGGKRTWCTVIEGRQGIQCTCETYQEAK